MARILANCFTRNMAALVNRPSSGAPQTAEGRMSERGVFAIDRGAWDHDYLADPQPFSRREAWFWIVSEAAWKRHRRRILGRPIEVHRGELAASYRFIASKWKWSEARVRRFVSGLISEGMVDAKTDAGLTVITVCNYDRYQRVSLPDDAMHEGDGDAGATQERRKVEDKEYKEEEVISSARALDDWPADFEAQFWARWPNKVAKVPGMKALAKARKRVAFAVLMAGLQLFIDSTDPRFYGHPATWLNADRWTDEPQPRNGHGQRPGDHRTAGAAGPPKTGADAILAGMGRIAARVAARGAAARSDGALPFSDDPAIVVDADVIPDRRN
jgi:hypothetical protein